MISPANIGQLPTCSICLNEIQENARRLETVCQHIFHRSCLHQWLTTNESSHCPNCRTVTAISFRTLFEEDYATSSVYCTALNSNFVALRNRLWAIQESADTVEENSRLLANFAEIQSILTSFQGDCYNVYKELQMVPRELDIMDAVISERYNTLLARERLPIDIQTNFTRFFISDYIPLQKEIEERQSSMGILSQRLEIEIPKLERRLSEINTQLLD